MLFEIRNYISGYLALNIPSPENTTGDWHPIYGPKIKEIFWYGEDYPKRNNLDCLGIYGIREASCWMKMEGFTVPEPCFVANHFRAVLDLVYSASADGVHDANRFLSEEFFDLPWQKKEVLVQALKMAKFYNSQIIYDWVKSESKRTYGFNSDGVFDIQRLEKIAWDRN